MKKILKTMLIAIFFTGITANAQQRAALHNNGNTTIFSGINPFVDAYNASVDGDTIYLSGGGFVSPTTIDKGLTIFGAGFHPDSTTATYPTFITTGTIYLGENSDNLHLEGLEFININKARDVQTNNLIIKRCKIASHNFSYNGGAIVTSINFRLVESIVTGTISLDGISNSIISNSIIQGQLNNSSNNTIQNNLFLNQIYSSNCNNNIYSNNIYSNTHGSILFSSTGNIFENNMFTLSSPDLSTGAIDNNNYKGLDLTTVYINQTGFVFDYAHDYHLQNAAATTYLGSDGTQVGVYGGLFPYKEGAVPVNPHIQLKSIAPQTDINGNLNIQLKVAAQDN